MKLLAIKQDPTPGLEYRLFSHSMLYEIDRYYRGQFDAVCTMSVSRSQILIDFLKIKLGGRGDEVKPG